MLQIYVYGPTQEGFLEMPPETRLSIESRDELFDEDFQFGEFTLPVDVPWTPTNRKILGFSERLQNFSIKDSWFRCNILDSGFTELASAKLTILERNGQLSYQRGSFSASISGNKGLFGSKIKNKKLSDLNLGGIINWAAGTNSRLFAEAHMKGATPQYPYLAFAPVAIENFIDTERKDYTSEFLAKDTVNYVFKTGTGPNDWIFANPSVDDASQPATQLEEDYIHFYTIPFLQLKYVMSCCFTEMGFTLSGNWFSSTAFDGLFLFNNYAIEKYRAIALLDNNTSINPANHVPDMLIGDFLRAVCSTFNLMIRYPGEDHCVVEWRKDQFADRRTMNITQLVAQKFSGVPLNPENKKGYTIEYAFDSADDYPGDIIKSLEGKTMVATVFTKADLVNIPTIGLNTDCIALVVAENLYYVVADATDIPVVWEVYSENLDKQVYGDGENGISLPIAPMCQYTEIQSGGGGLKVRRNYVGCRMKGSYQNYNRTRVQSPFGLRMFYIDMLDTGDGVVIPVSSNHDTDAMGNKRHNYSLAFNTNNGIDTAFHRDWQIFNSRGDIIKLNIRVDKKIIAEMNNAGRFELAGVLMYRMNTERTIPLKREIAVEMVTL